MLELTLPDGSVRSVAESTLPSAVVGSIGERLLRAAIAVEVNGVVQDLVTPLRSGGSFRVLTERDPEALPVLRHSAAHLLATAVRRVRPDAQIGFGPSIDDGFYYDFGVDHPFTPEDLETFEKQMRKIAAEKFQFVRAELDRAGAERVFQADPLKLERLSELPDSEVISTYTDGPFTDLCRGPHVQDTSYIKHFKLMSTAGAYWRGDEKRQMLQRIYGTAWFRKEDLDAYLYRIEEAKRRDHRRLGKELDLFQFHPIAPGAAFWTNRGTIIYNGLVDFMREKLRAAGYDEVKTPLLYHKTLWEQSGHWGKYKENMFLVLDNETGDHDFSLKPMNCPSHHVLYASRKHSYRELPVRYATQDVLHRNEISGALSGLTRVRQFQQDDAHVYLAESQITEEVKNLVEMVNDCYGVFGLSYTAKFATRPGPEFRVGTDEMWDRAEEALRAALVATGLPYELKEGDGAFYGPKIDFDVTDSIGRQWQLGTIQLDYANPERFDLTYTGEDNQAHRPVIIHRAILGSFERFIAILIEHFAGAFPLWLAPEQVRIVPISDAQFEAAGKVRDALVKVGVRAHLDDRNQTLNYRIREAETLKIPYMAVVGGREAEEGTVAIRTRGAGSKQDVTPLADFVARVQSEIASRSLMP
ncbi:MAG: threonine--tRNA ligase [Gemmatimonadaceae bacterium]